MQGSFSYMNVDPANVRNQAGIGGGGLYDIGYYPILTSRSLYEAEPTRVASQIEYDPNFKTDRLASRFEAKRAATATANEQGAAG